MTISGASGGERPDFDMRSCINATAASYARRWAASEI